MVSKGHALAREALVRTLTAYSGITTADGAFDGTTMIDSTLIGRNDFISEKTILIMSGDAVNEDKGSLSFNSVTGEITLQGTGFSAQIKAGTVFRVLNISTTEIDVANINAKIGINTDPPGTTTVFARLRQIIDTYLASGTYGLAAIEAHIDAIEAGLGRKYSFMDFWSALEDKITVSNVATDINYPDIAVSGLPVGATLKRVVLIMAARAINDTSASNNYINAASKTLRIKKSTGAWGTDDVIGITFDQNSLYCVASSKEAGPTIIGSVDIKGEVDGDATYNVQSNQTNRADAIVALGASIELYDVQVGLRVFFE